jgi:hypothetical protein
LAGGSGAAGEEVQKARRCRNGCQSPELVLIELSKCWVGPGDEGAAGGALRAPGGEKSHTAGYEGIFGPFWAKSRLPYPYEPPYASTVLPTVGPRDYPLPGY